MSEQQVWTDDDIKESTHRSMEHHKGVGFVVQQWRVKSLIARVRDDWQADHDDMQAKLDAANARIAELEQRIAECERSNGDDTIAYVLQSKADGERIANLIDEVNRLRAELDWYNSTRATCSAAWAEIDDEVERLQESEGDDD